MIIQAIFHSIKLTAKYVILFLLVLIPSQGIVWAFQTHPKEALGGVLFLLFCVLVYDEYMNLRLQKKLDEIRETDIDEEDFD